MEIGDIYIKDNITYRLHYFPAGTHINSLPETYGAAYEIRTMSQIIPKRINSKEEHKRWSLFDNGSFSSRSLYAWVKEKEQDQCPKEWGEVCY